ncbi:phage virion morphogenesis protein [Erwinia psidii]|uniref:phage virion morphogenesis protein n=1 Tax=Erwinia psidii TaxID=69224 RepID=UPI00226B08CA|nr:phage virion morphogenesis protein [Erwinia psidii]MCX8957218.1 phage virion morphogenesis protein [Erwinia psidii]
MKLDIDISDEFREWLDRLAERCQHREPLMNRVAGIMLDAVDENFMQGGRPAWTPLKYGDGKLLMKTRRLHGSIEPFADNDHAVVGTNVVYARIHQMGGKTRPHIIRPRDKKALRFNGRFASKVNHPGSDIPARPFLSLTEEDNDAIRQAVIDHLGGED